jgi:hypothetical protein
MKIVAITVLVSLWFAPEAVAESDLTAPDAPSPSVNSFSAQVPAVGCPKWVKLRRTQPEQRSSGLPPKADIAQYRRHFAFVPIATVSKMLRLDD